MGCVRDALEEDTRWCVDLVWFGRQEKEVDLSCTRDNNAVSPQLAHLVGAVPVHLFPCSAVSKGLQSVRKDLVQVQNTLRDVSKGFP